MKKPSALLDLSASLLALLKEAGAHRNLTDDQVVECVRTNLVGDLDIFLQRVKRTFENGTSPRRRALQLYRRFLRENRERIGELVLSGQVDP